MILSSCRATDARPHSEPPWSASGRLRAGRPPVLPGRPRSHSPRYRSGQELTAVLLNDAWRCSFQQGLPYLSPRRGLRPHLGSRFSAEFERFTSSSTRRPGRGGLVPKPLQSRPRGESAARLTSVPHKFGDRLSPKNYATALRRKIRPPPCAEFGACEVTPDISI